MTKLTKEEKIIKEIKEEVYNLLAKEFRSLAMEMIESIIEQREKKEESDNPFTSLMETHISQVFHKMSIKLYEKTKN